MVLIIPFPRFHKFKKKFSIYPQLPHKITIILLEVGKSKVVV